MGSVSVGCPEGASNWRQEAISDDKYIPGIKVIADAVHKHGAKLAVQLHHAGLFALDGRPLACPSVPHASKDSGDFVDVMLEEEQKIFFEPYSKMGEVSYAPLEPEQMARITEMFAAATLRARKTGADAVEIHAGHGYIFSSFLSPDYNQRTECEYGGKVENRARFLLETIRGIRSAVGPDFPVWMRFDSQEFLMDVRITLEDAIRTAQLAEEAGLDAIHVSAHGDGNCGGTYTTGHARHHAQWVYKQCGGHQKAVKILVTCPGRIEPEDADHFIKVGKLDFMTMGRKLLADLHLPDKLLVEKPEEIRPCIYCYTCISNIFSSKHVICAVNPLAGYGLVNPMRALCAGLSGKWVKRPTSKFTWKHR